jgi:putative SOS response-associated peptidase YedK
MCGRYTVISPAPGLAERFGAKEAASPAPNFNAAPSQALPIITNAARPNSVGALGIGA